MPVNITNLNSRKIIFNNVTYIRVTFNTRVLLNDDNLDFRLSSFSFCIYNILMDIIITFNILEVLSMIVWFFFSIVIGLSLFIFDKRAVGVLGVIFAMLLLITNFCTTRVYQAERFHKILPREDCVIKEDGDVFSITYGSSKYVFRGDRVVEYIAETKNQEVIEIEGEYRMYYPIVPDFIYYIYFLGEPELETITHVSTVNISTYRGR